MKSVIESIFHFTNNIDIFEINFSVLLHGELVLRAHHLLS
jgi:hypothetical protein